MPSAHCDSNGSSGSGDQMPGLAGVHDADDDGSRMGHNTDCAQPMLMPYFFFSFQLQITTHTYEERQRIYLFIAVHTSFILFGCFPHTTRKKNNDNGKIPHARQRITLLLHTLELFNARAFQQQPKKFYSIVLFVYSRFAIFTLNYNSLFRNSDARAPNNTHVVFSTFPSHNFSIVRCCQMNNGLALTFFFLLLFPLFALLLWRNEKKLYTNGTFMQLWFTEFLHKLLFIFILSVYHFCCYLFW